MTDRPPPAHAPALTPGPAHLLALFVQYEFYTILVARGQVTGGLASPNEPEVCGQYIFSPLLKCTPFGGGGRYLEWTSRGNVYRSYDGKTMPIRRWVRILHCY